MKRGTLLLVIFCLLLTPNVNGQTPTPDAQPKWRTESVSLPPGFAPKVNLKGKAKVYFAPGWGKKKSDQFFSYFFLFQTEAEPKFEKAVIEKELLAYFGGLAARVSRGKVDPETFEMTVEKAAVEEMKGDEVKLSAEVKEFAADWERFNAKLKWTNPFFGRSKQTLNLEIASQFNATDMKNYLMVSVSPQDPAGETEASSKVWGQLRKMQAGFSGDPKVGVEASAKKPKKPK